MGGASIIYVHTFCSELLGESSSLDFCRAELKSKCDIDVLSWFKNSPAQSIEVKIQIQKCIQDKFKKESNFLENSNEQAKRKESLRLSEATNISQNKHLIGSNPFRGKKIVY